MSTAQAAPNKALLNEVAHVDASKLKDVETKESSGLTQAKLLKSLEKDHTKELAHVKTQESSGLTQAKLLVEVSKDHTKDLKHVDAPTEGVSDAVKQAFLEDKKRERTINKLSFKHTYLHLTKFTCVSFFCILCVRVTNFYSFFPRIHPFVIWFYSEMSHVFPT